MTIALFWFNIHPSPIHIGEILATLHRREKVAMKKQHSASAVVENNKGGNKSNISLSISIHFDRATIVSIYALSIVVNFQRNGHPFRVERSTKDVDKRKFLNEVCDAMCSQIVSFYDDKGLGNVDTTPILEFVKNEFEKFIQELEKS